MLGKLNIPPSPSPKVNKPLKQLKMNDNNDVPNYYVGKKLGYKAKDIDWDYDCSYNVGTSITYLLRCQRKHSSPIECIEKAIHHLEFELEELEAKRKKNIRLNHI